MSARPNDLTPVLLVTQLSVLTVQAELQFVITLQIGNIVSMLRLQVFMRNASIMMTIFVTDEIWS